jgi:hypothetical protein
MTARGRLIIYGSEAHLDTDGPLEVGDTFDVVRGAGPREGDWMGTATVTALDENGEPTLDVRFGDAERKPS